MFDSQESLLALLVNDCCQLGILLLHLLDNLLLDALLLKDLSLHGGALLVGCFSRAQKFLELVDLECAGLFERHSATAATVQVEVAVIAEGLVVDAAVSLEGVLVVAHANLCGASGCLGYG